MQPTESSSASNSLSRRISFLLFFTLFTCLTLFTHANNITSHKLQRITLTSTQSTYTSSTAQASTGLQITVNGKLYSYNSCNSFSLNIQVCWTLNEADNVVSLAVMSPSNGWLAMGISPSGDMVGSSAMIGWCSSDSSNKQIDNYELTSKDQSGVSVTQKKLQATEMDIGYVNGQTVLVFTLPLHNSYSAYSIDVAGSTNLIFAKGPLPASSTSQPQQHYSNSRVAGASINFFTGQTNNGNNADRTIYIKVHAALMSIAWGFLLPIGIVCARYLKHKAPLWFHLHRICNVTAVVMAIVAWILIGRSDEGYNTHTHGPLGVTVLLLAIFQPIIGVLRPHAPSPGEPPTKIRWLWQLLHNNCGRVVFVGAVVNSIIGFDLFQPGVGYLALFCTSWGLIVCCGLALEFHNRFIVSRLSECTVSSLQTDEQA